MKKQVKSAVVKGLNKIFKTNIWMGMMSGISMYNVEHVTTSTDSIERGGVWLWKRRKMFSDVKYYILWNK